MIRPITLVCADFMTGSKRPIAVDDKLYLSPAIHYLWHCGRKEQEALFRVLRATRLEPVSRLFP